MPYTPTTWVEGVTKLGPTNMNHLETGVSGATTTADGAIAKPASPASNDGLVWNGSTWTNAKLVNANIDPAAGIVYSKLSLAGGIVNNDINASAAIVASKLSGYPSDATKVLKGDGTWGSASVTTELAYNEITSSVSAISATTEGTSTAVIAGSSVAYDGTAVMIEFFCPTWQHDTSGANMTLLLYDGASVVGRLWQGNAYTGTQPMFPISARRKLTPSVASHTYNVKAFVSSGNGTIVAGASGTGAYLASFIRVTRAA